LKTKAAAAGAIELAPMARPLKPSRRAAPMGFAIELFPSHGGQSGGAAINGNVTLHAGERKLAVNRSVGFFPPGTMSKSIDSL
jgi:hypothetical protein